jgi:hypothetical protein
MVPYVREPLFSLPGPTYRLLLKIRSEESVMASRAAAGWCKDTFTVGLYSMLVEKFTLVVAELRRRQVHAWRE